MFVVISKQSSETGNVPRDTTHKTKRPVKSYLLVSLGKHLRQLFLGPHGCSRHVLCLVTLMRGQLAVQADGHLTLAALEAQHLVRVELAHLLAACRFGSRSGCHWADRMVAGTAHQVMQAAAGATHVLLTCAAEEHRLLLLTLFTHATQHWGSGLGFFIMVHCRIQVEIGLKIAMRFVCWLVA